MHDNHPLVRGIIHNVSFILETVKKWRKRYKFGQILLFFQFMHDQNKETKLTYTVGIKTFLSPIVIKDPAYMHVYV